MANRVVRVLKLPLSFTVLHTHPPNQTYVQDPLFLLLVVFVFIAACGTQVSKPAPTTDTTPVDNTTGTIPPVETEAANTNYPPAFAGQTRIAGVRTTTPYKSEVLSSNLSKPWGIAALPDGRFLITEKKAPCGLLQQQAL